MMSRRHLLLGFSVMSWAVAVARGVERLPVEDFAREPTTARAQLSPDGKRLAFIREDRGWQALHILNIDENRVFVLDLGEATIPQMVLMYGNSADTVSIHARKLAASFRWVGNERLIITAVIWDNVFCDVEATDWNGSRDVPISGHKDDQMSLAIGRQYFREVIHCFYDDEQSVLMLDRHEGGAGLGNRPDILRVDTVTGVASVAAKNPGEVASWSLDASGVARLGILSHGDLSGAIYREAEGAPWKTILPLSARANRMHAIGFDAAKGQPLVKALNTEKRWAIYPLAPDTGELGPPLATDPEYDIIPDRTDGLEVDGIPLATPIFSPKAEAVLGVRYVTDALRVRWFDKEFPAYQAAIDRAMPDTVNLFVNASLDGKRQLWLAFSDQDPGVYLLLDLEKHILSRLAPRMAWIKPAQMAPMLAIKYPARDGLTIRGYLTVPVGHEPKNLPMVVMPHGGPWVRDVWKFDPLVQLLANRGYAVLQMNYRGSPGYGEELFAKARREVGKAIQDDIEDATRWAVGAGVADPRKIAIMGMSYGGYSTLFALGHSPGLYRCGISMAGVSDWPEIFDARRHDAEAANANRYWRREIGDPDKDQEFLRAISPVNFADRITAPVLIIQGKDDHTVPRDQAKLMIAALEQAGRPPESLFISDLGHTFGNAKQRLQIYGAVVAFLGKNLGPGVQ